MLKSVRIVNTFLQIQSLCTIVKFFFILHAHAYFQIDHLIVAAIIFLISFSSIEALECYACEYGPDQKDDNCLTVNSKTPKVSLSDKVPCAGCVVRNNLVVLCFYLHRIIFYECVFRQKIDMQEWCTPQLVEIATQQVSNAKMLILPLRKYSVVRQICAILTPD